MLSSGTLKKLQLKQKKLDEFIWENYRKRNNITTDDVGKTKESFVRTKIALLVEIGELANELKTFKH
jgi:dimeric dUTPase (all-alpha-NTP-PPase superfamily)